MLSIPGNSRGWFALRNFAASDWIFSSLLFSPIWHLEFVAVDTLVNVYWSTVCLTPILSGRMSADRKSVV